MARKQTYLPLHQILQLVDLETRLGRHTKRGIAEALVVFHHHAHFPDLLVSIKVALVEHQGGRNVISFSGDQETVDEAR